MTLSARRRRRGIISPFVFEIITIAVTDISSRNTLSYFMFTAVCYDNILYYNTRIAAVYDVEPIFNETLYTTNYLMEPRIMINVY